VIATDVLALEVRAVAAELESAAVALTHDVTDPAGWTAAVQAAVEHFGGLDVLVNNAGIHWIRPLVDEDPDDVERMLKVNLLGPYLGLQAGDRGDVHHRAAAPGRHDGDHGLQGAWGHSAYGASKWGLRGLTKTAAIELGPQGIRVNSVHPGPIDTAMLPVAPTGGVFAAQAISRAGTAEEVAEAVLWLASDAAAYVTGAEVAVDGGLAAGPLPKFARRTEEA
jgi:3alpha(or 20beta)-hydroxysteroid dehydrogenase